MTGHWWLTALGLLLALTAAYAVLLLWLWRFQRRHPESLGLRDALRLVPDLARMLGRMARDRDLPRGVRVRLALLAVYLASPIDLVPDFVPVLGYADDVLITALVLRSTVRAAGPDAMTRHWPGSAQGLAAVQRLAGLSP